jgi:serine/threonine protein kinase
MEYLSKGSLDKVLQIEEKNIELSDFLRIIKSIIAGMQYLVQKNIVHRDLSLRNLLVGRGNELDKYIVKISDFGLSRIMGKNYYKTDDATIPIRWSAPEVLEKGIFSSKSDVWSFGIVLWELFSLGNIPYTGMTNKEVIQFVLSDNRLEKPTKCPDEIYELMLKCWNKNPQERPTFQELYYQIIDIEKKYLLENTSHYSYFYFQEDNNESHYNT